MSDTLMIRDYQVEARYKRECSEKRTSILLAPPGAGKTIIACDLTTRAIERSKRALFMAPRIELIGQMCEKLDQYAPFEYGVIAARGSNRHGGIYAPVQVCSVDTLVSRCLKRNSLQLPEVDEVYVDECHLYATPQRTALLQSFPRARITGFTATPARTDGTGLGGLFEEIIEVTTPKKLIAQGWLIAPRYFAPSTPDLSRIRLIGGDYDEAETALRMEPLLGDALEHWLRLAADRRTIVFCVKVGHSVFMAERFRRAGIAAEHCDGTMTDERDNVFTRFRSGETQVLVNVELATYGFDLPEIGCVVQLRPTKSVTKYLQMVGRGARPCPAIGKRDFISIDHAGNTNEHGYFEDDRYWTLDGGAVRARQTTPRQGQQHTERKTLTCPKCSFVFDSSLTCSNCGHFFERAAREFFVHEGELVPYRVDEDEAASELQRMRFFCELLGHARAKGYKEGWAAHAYKDKFKAFPPRQWNTYDPLEPSSETRGYLKYLQIRRAKSREKEQRRA